MAELSIVQASKLEASFRLDSEYYRPENLALSRMLAKFRPTPVASFAHVTDGIHASPDHADDDGVLYLSAKCVKDNEFDLSNTLRITREQHGQNARSSLADGDVLITSVGTIGNAAVVQRHLLPCNIDRHLGLIRPNDDSFSPWYLSAFLNSKFGRFQSLRESTGNVQLNLFIAKMRFLLIPHLSCEKAVEQLTRSAYETRENCKGYAEAEAEMLERMQWGTFRKRKVDLCYFPRYAITVANGRCDAEHFQPNLGRLRKQILASGKHIGDFCPVPRRGVQPEFIDSGSVWVVDSKSVRPGRLEPSLEEKVSDAFYNDPRNARARVARNDVLLNSTGRGTLGRAACWLHDEPAVTDNHVAILRPNASVCLPTYLALFLNSPAGLIQSEMFQCGSSGQLELYPVDVVKLAVFLPTNGNGRIDLAWQKKLAKKVVSAHAAMLAARANLKQAKAMIETEIQSGRRPHAG